MHFFNKMSRKLGAFFPATSGDKNKNIAHLTSPCSLQVFLASSFECFVIKCGEGKEIGLLYSLILWNLAISNNKGSF